MISDHPIHHFICVFSSLFFCAGLPLAWGNYLKWEQKKSLQFQVDFFSLFSYFLSFSILRNNLLKVETVSNANIMNRVMGWEWEHFVSKKMFFQRCYFLLRCDWHTFEFSVITAWPRELTSHVTSIYEWI